MKNQWSNILVVCAICVMSSAHAVDANNLVGTAVSGSVSKSPLTEAEVKSMPSACITIGMGRIDGVFWVEAMVKNKTMFLLDLPENAMAKNANWFHHFCWARLAKMRSINAKSRVSRQSEIKSWRMNMQFIVDWTAKQKVSWPYLPVVYTDIAETFLVEKNYAQAILHAEKALSLKAGHADAFVILADCYAAVGNKGKALDKATEGLKYVPESKGLKRRYAELGGKLPLPEPYASANGVADAEKVVEKEGKPEAVNIIKDDVEKQQTGKAPGSEVQIEIDGKAGIKNPHCRFCP